MKVIASIRCLCNLDTFPSFFFFPGILGHQQIIGYQIPPFWQILETSICNHFHFPTPIQKDKKVIFLINIWEIFRSISLRTVANTSVAIVASWVVVLGSCSPLLFVFDAKDISFPHGEVKKCTRVLCCYWSAGVRKAVFV